MSDKKIQRLLKSYEEVPYFSQAYLQSHPDRLAVLGRLFGLRPALVTNCRVLELGCASGGNIIPIAYYLPDSRFVGVELTSGHVESAHRTIKDLGLKNIRIENENILNIDSSWGKFDYIICHGVFSWVPEEVQNKIFSIISENLSDDGVAYISYNTYPGWHMREAIRHMMLYHSNQFKDPEQRLGQARGFINFLSESVAVNDEDPYGLLLKNEIKSLKNSGDWYVFHDYMEVVNLPVYFHQFMERAEKYGLQYLAEASFELMFNHGFSDDVSNTLEQVSQDIIQKEQYMDFLRNRFFRQTLLCKKEHNLTRTLDAKSMERLLVSSAILPVDESVDLAKGAMQKFKVSEDKFIETENPVLKAAFIILRERWPFALSFEDLLDQSINMLNNAGIQNNLSKKEWEKELGRGLLHSYVLKLTELRTWQGRYMPKVSELPRINDLTLYQIKHSQSVVNHRHETVNIDQFAEHLILLLDGSNNKKFMLENLTKLAMSRKIILKKYDLPITDPKKIRKTLEKSINRVLASLADAALLIS